MASLEHEFCKNYLELKPEAATLFDLLRILCCKDLDEREFLNCSIPGGGVVEFQFRHRWIVFVSVLAQKTLIHLKKPMAVLGSTAELALNYPAFNGGLRGLFFNLLTGRLVRPDESSEKFTSIVGNVDKRWDLNFDLEKKMSNDGHQRCYASLAIMASKLSYENQAFVQNVVTHIWQMEFLGFYNFWNDFQEANTTHAIMFRHRARDGGSSTIVVAFRGTEPFDADAWRTDIDISWYEFQGIGKIHHGFAWALGLQKPGSFPKETPPQSVDRDFAYYALRDELKSLISSDKDLRLVVTGHSLGGALAVLFGSVLAIHNEEELLQRLEGVYTFGQPRIGNVEFGEYMKTYNNLRYYRYVYCNDIVPRLPYDDHTFFFKHFGSCLYFNSFYHGQVLDEEPNKNYFSVIQAIPKVVNAMYELVRGLFFPWTKGEEYREGWSMKVFRLMALVFPGLTDHVLVDYVNLTRLGKLSSSSGDVLQQGVNQNLKQE